MVQDVVRTEAFVKFPWVKNIEREQLEAAYDEATELACRWVSLSPDYRHAIADADPGIARALDALVAALRSTEKESAQP